MNQIGKPVLREEDLRLLQGLGRYTDDVDALGQAHAFVLRSPIAHAKIQSIDTEKAENFDGVLAVLTGEDLVKRNLGGLKPAFAGQRSDGKPGFVCSQPLLAQERVRFIGEPVAFVIAEKLNQAKDAAELIFVDYQPLKPLISVDEALESGAPKIWDENQDNEAYTFERGDASKVTAAFADAEYIVHHRVCVNRVACNAMETRGCIGTFDSYENRYTLRATVQSVHGIRQQNLLWL